jgi:hypothetical protein
VRQLIRQELIKSLDAKIVDSLLDAHEEAKRNWYLGGLRLSEVEGGRFCEAAFRLLQQIATGTFTPLGQQLNSQALINALASMPPASAKESVRLHIPRALRMVYDIRNKRNAAHLADGIDPNLQDATLIIAAIDWVLAELIRLYHPGMQANDAQRAVENIVTRAAPVIQEFDGFLKVLDPDLRAGDFILVLLYHRGAVGATYAELDTWAKPPMRGNLKTTLARLVDDRAFVHFDGTRYFITRPGQHEVESRQLLGSQ